MLFYLLAIVLVSFWQPVQEMFTILSSNRQDCRTFLLNLREWWYFWNALFNTFLTVLKNPLAPHSFKLSHFNRERSIESMNTVVKMTGWVLNELELINVRKTRSFGNADFNLIWGSLQEIYAWHKVLLRCKKIWQLCDGNRQSKCLREIIESDGRYTLCRCILCWSIFWKYESFLPDRYCID